MSAAIVREQTFTDGLVIQADATDQRVVEYVKNIVGQVTLIGADSPYGEIVDNPWDKVRNLIPDLDPTLPVARVFADWLTKWTLTWTELLVAGGAMYSWGGIGKPGFRPFYMYLHDVEERSNGCVNLANHITWKKKRAYGIQHNYLFTREECAYFIKADDIRKPHCFNVPLREEKRGYAGYDLAHPAKSEFLRRSNVWDEPATDESFDSVWDISEIFRGKIHKCQKPNRVSEIPIEVHTKLGEYVIDLFAGSGSLSAAARRLGRKWIAIENGPAEFDTICKRMEQPSP